MSDTRIVFGFHAVAGVVRRRPEAVLEVMFDAERKDARARDLAAAARERGVRIHEVEGARLDSLAGTRRHQGVVARVTAHDNAPTLDSVLDSIDGRALLLVLDGVQDPHNLGACLRVADAFGVHAVIAPKDRAVGLTATVAKVASGAVETVPYVAVTNLARALGQIKDAGIWAVAADQEAGVALPDARLAGPLAWVLGAEGQGLRRLTRDSCDEIVRIPMAGSVESLNVSVAAGICLYEALRQRLATR
jgi:23S rRNA (guanosine2251-2'-O)-methyltransferase